MRCFGDDGVWLTQLRKIEVVDVCAFQYLLPLGALFALVVVRQFTAATPVTWTVMFCPV